MSCPICDNKPANCDCSDAAIRLHEEKEQLLLQVGELKAQDEVRSGRWCLGNMAEGRGPCGICPKCSKANFDRAEAAEIQLKESNRLNDELRQALRDVLEISEVEGAVNLTVMESAKLMAIRDLVPKDEVKR